MATDNLTSSLASRANSAPPLTVFDIVKAIVMPLASLKLTVALLGLAIFVTFVATLEQTRADVFDVKMRHFSALFVDVPFQTFFVPAWVPERQNIPGQFLMPSGLLVLIMLLVNLTAAHLMRFKLQASGTRLVVGLVAALFAGFVTWAIIFNGQNADGFQAAPPISYEVMWMIMQAGLLGLVIAGIAGFVLMDKTKRVERAVIASATLIPAALLAITLIFGEQAFIGDSAMRVLWQIAQATLAAVISFVACMVLFKRKAGMVLLHLGVAGLMVNEIFVTVTNDEYRMTILENQTVSHAVDIRFREMAIIDVSDPDVDNIVTVPSELLYENLQDKNAIDNPSLPFKIRCRKYLPASNLRTITDATKNIATKGLGLIGEAFSVPPVAGTDAEQVADFASAYVELFDKKTDESLGVFLLSQAPSGRDDQITVDGKDYFINLRFRTEYKPYSLTLLDAQRENYPGTDTPKYYGSKVILKDFRTDLETEQPIFMNNPLRYADETFYQSGMDRLDDGREYTVLQIVTNVGWMIPYVCCMFSVVGLIAQFGVSLLAFLNKQTKPKKDGIPVAGLAESRLGASAWAPAIVLVLFFGVWGLSLLSKGFRPVTKDDTELRLDRLAELPVTFEGRVQPLGSFAINTARQLRERESLANGENETQPAIRWLADLVFEAEGAEDYRTFRITDPNIISALKLPKRFALDPDRSKFIYTIDELLEARSKLNSLVPDPKAKDPKTWTTIEKRLAAIRGKLNRVFGMKLLFGPIEEPNENFLMQLELYGAAMASSLTPYPIPSDETDKAWVSASEAEAKNWLFNEGNKRGAKTTQELAANVIKTDVLPTIRADEIQNQVIRRFMSIPEFVELQKKQLGEDDPQKLAALIKQNWDNIPEDLRNKLEQGEAPLVDAVLAERIPGFVQRLEEQIRIVNGSASELGAGGIDMESRDRLRKLKTAYLENDAKTFNETLEAQIAAVKSAQPYGLSSTKLQLEKYYNSFTPFYVSMVVYIAASIFVLISWLGVQVRWLNVSMARVAMSLLVLGMVIHGTGLVMRVIISGRPPVTNLYSSVLFVGLFGVMFLTVKELFTRKGIGSLLAGLAGFGSLIWAHSMTIVDGDTFTVMVAVLDTTFWLATHVVCISIGYAATFVAGLFGMAYLIGGLVTPVMRSPSTRKMFINLMYGSICFGLLTSYFGTVLGGLWGDDSWGRFWGWDPKENGALMIVLANALILHARWGGMVKERGIAALAVLSNIIVLWSWKGVNALGVGLHAYSGTEDQTLMVIIGVGIAHLMIAMIGLIPKAGWMSYAEGANS